MQNFTLGKRGLSMLFFAFFLLTFSFSSYAQENCPTVTRDDDETETGFQQNFCYLATVSDLEANANGDAVRWYRTASSTNPIPENELLQTETYFAGNESGRCTSRVPVEVTIDNIGPPTTQFGNFFQPCEYNTQDTSTVQDLIDNVNGNEVEIFADEFGSNALASTTVLIEGNSYFAGQRNPETSCRTSRLALRYDPVLAEAPTGESEQTFCEGATVADLEATFTSPNGQAIRWYSTLTSNPALNSSTPLVNGEMYYASQIVNRNNSSLPPCESENRFEVTVILEPAAFNESVQRFCESIGEGNDFRKPEVRDLSPDGATWFADATSTEALDPQTELIDGEDYFNRANGSECSQDRVVVDLFPTPNAGRTTETSFCENDDPENLVDRINDSQLGAPDQTGFFTPALSTGTNIFNPEDYEPGSYSFTYTVEGNEDCPTDTSQITVVVEDAPNAGAPVNEEVCSAQLENFPALAAQFSSLLEGRDTGGTFNPSLEILFAQFNNDPSGPFTTTYTVGAEGECQDSAQITVTVIDSPEAGENGSVELTRDDAPFNLFTELEGNPDANGTWSPGNADGSFDPATGEAGTYTYTVNNGECSDTATVSVSFENECPVVENTTQSFCQSIGEGNNFRRPQVSDLMPTGATWYASADSDEALASNTVLVDGNTYFAGNSQGTCNDRTPVLVNLDEAPNAGRTTAINICSNDAPFDVVSRINPSILGAPDANGTFSPALASGTTIFDPSVDAAGTYTYTVQSENDGCPDDSSIITVNITNVDAGEDGSVELSREDAPFNLFTELNGTPDPNGTWSPGNADGSFDPATGEAGTYTYTVSNGGCTDTATVSVFFEDECPVVDNTTQSFCQSIGEGNNFRRPRISDLMPTGATWYETADSDEAITDNRLLVDGTTYFAGNSQGTCNDRTPVLVNIDEAPNAGRTTAIAVCSNEAAFDVVSRINDSQLGAPDANGTFSPAFASGTTIFDPAVDAGGTYTYTVQSENEGCPDDSSIITINVTNVNAGENGAVEVSREDAPFNLFSELNGTPDASGTWSPGNANGSFNPATGEAGTYTYTVTNGNCTDTATVTVTITEEIECPVVADTEQAFCQSIGEGNDSRRPRVSDLMPTGATWYATATSTEALAANTVLIDGEDYFAGNENGNCTSRERVVVTLDQAPNAGRTTALNVCSSEAPFDLVTRINESILGAPDAGGTFSPSLASGTTIFDPSVDTAGTYTYTVQSENEACADDSSIITITITNGIVEAPINETFCSAELNNVGDFVNEFSSLLEGRDTGGTFAPTLETLFAQYSTSPIGTFTTVYTVGAEGECQSSVEINVTVQQSPNAGQDGTVEVSREDASFNLFTELNGTPDTGGTWSPGNTDGSFNPATGEAGTYTYTVTNGLCTDTATVTVTITDETVEPVCPVVTDNTQSFCESIDVGNASRRPRVSDLMPANAVWYETATSTTPLASTIVLINGEDYFAGNADVTCPARPRVVVTLDESPNAGRTTEIIVCSDDASFDLLDRINESILGAPDAGGTFTPALASGTTVFNPAVDVATTYTYRVESTNDVCPADTAQITVRINQSGEANAGDPFTLDYCVTTEDVDLFAELGEGVTQGGTFEGYPNGIFSPATLGEGTYVVNYNVGEGLPCITGTDSSTLTITVTASGETPVADAEQTFCLIDSPTVGDIVVDGENIVIYTDADLLTEADLTSSLVDGEDYYAVSSSTGNACGSDAVMITVVLTDADAPTLIDEVEGGEFCRSDNPTVQELISNLNGSGIQIYTSLTGGTALATTTALEDGVTYFASATNSTTQCESSERRAVQVEVGFCGIPEGFSPNDDGKNDEFVIPDIATDFPNYTIQVYNRWGSLVFEGNASTGDWDGLSNQSATLGDGVLPSGVYFYILDYNDGQTQPVQGKVYLSR